MEGRKGEERSYFKFWLPGSIFWREAKGGDGSKISHESTLAFPQKWRILRGENIYLKFGLNNPIQISSLVKPNNIFKSLPSLR